MQRRRRNRTQKPTPELSASPETGKTPLESTITLSLKPGSENANKFELDYKGNNAYDTTSSSPISLNHTYNQDKQIRGKVTNNAGSNTTTKNIDVQENQPPQINLTTTPDNGLEPLEVRIQLTQTDPDGDFEKYKINFDQGNGTEQINTTELDTLLTYTKDATIRATGIDQKGLESTEQTKQINVTPTHQVTLQLRNLTQPGEPFETDGQTTYTIGDSTATPNNGEITFTLPEGTHQVDATNPNYYPEWTYIRTQEMTLKQQPIEQTDTQDHNSPININQDITLQLYKINQNDLENITKPYGDAVTGRDYYNMEDVATILDSRQEPGTERYIGITEENPLIVWINTQESNSQPTTEIENAINEWTTTTTGFSAHHFTQGYLGPHNITIQQGGQQPKGHFIEIIYDTTETADGRHGETMDEDNPNKILYSGVTLNPEKADRGVTLEELTQTIGARQDIVNRLEPDLTGKNSNEYADKYGTFGTILGKLLYTTHAGTNYKKE